VLASNHPDLAHAVIAISDVCARIEALCVLNLFQCPLAAVGRTDTRDRVRRKDSAVVTTELLQHTGGNNLPFVRSKRVENTATVSRRWLVHVRKQERTPRARHVAIEHLAQERAQLIVGKRYLAAFDESSQIIQPCIRALPSLR